MLASHREGTYPAVAAMAKRAQVREVAGPAMDQLRASKVVSHVDPEMYDGLRSRPCWRIYTHVIAHGPISAMDVARALSMHESQVYQTMKAGIRRGLRIRVIEGKPRLYAMSREDAPIPVVLPARVPADLSIAGLLRFYGALEDVPAARASRTRQPRDVAGDSGRIDVEPASRFRLALAVD